MGIIDFHTHIFPDHLAGRAIETLTSSSTNVCSRLDGTASGLKISMQKAGITGSVILPVSTKVTQVESINDWILSLQDPEFIAFGTIHPKDENPCQTVDSLRRNRVRGIKFHPEYQNFCPDDMKMFPVYESLAEAGMIAVFHAGEDPGPFTHFNSSPEAIAHIVNAFPDLRVVAAHMGGFKMWEMTEKYLCGLDVYFDTSAVSGEMPEELFLRIAKKHDIGKILFGTDSPWFSQEESLSWIDSLPLKSSEKEMIFEKNAKRLLNIN